MSSQPGVSRVLQKVGQGALQLSFPLGALIAGLLTELWPDLVSPLGQAAMLAMVVTILGLPHGALDPWIGERLWPGASGRRTAGFAAAYLLVATAVLAVWWLQPVASLAVFLLISGWHFSADWAKDLPLPARLVLGGLLLLMPIGFHTEAVAGLFVQISGPGGGQLAHGLALPVGLLLAGLLGVAGSALLRRAWWTLADCLALGLLAWSAPPLVYFALYFSLRHSPRHLRNLFQQAPRGEHARLWQMMVIYTAATLAMAGLAYSLLPPGRLDTQLLQLVFIGLAALTVPHMLLIEAAHRRHFSISAGR